MKPDLNIGDDVFYLGNCLPNGIIVKTTIKAIGNPSGLSARVYLLDGILERVDERDIALTEEEAIEKAEEYKQDFIERTLKTVEKVRNRKFTIKDHE